ncbi:MAG: HAD family hydrolase [Sphingomonadales bacterium]|nr:HAD family hydrolase [Sphingomonadales bacterium]
MTRPLIVSDCDEVLMHMVVPFRAWLDELHGIHFDFSVGFVRALRHKDSGDPVERARVWSLLSAFFREEMHRQTPIAGAVEAMARLSERADVVIVTNIGPEMAAARAAQIHAHALPYEVIGNPGGTGKGPAVAKLIQERGAPLTFFIDDLASNHVSVAQDVPACWRLHMVGEPELAPHVETAIEAHARIDDWVQAERWIATRLDEYDAVLAASHA